MQSAKTHSHQKRGLSTQSCPLTENQCCLTEFYYITILKNLATNTQPIDNCSSGRPLVISNIAPRLNPHFDMAWRHTGILEQYNGAILTTTNDCCILIYDVLLTLECSFYSL